MIKEFTGRLHSRFADRLLEQAKSEIGDAKPKMTLWLLLGLLFSLIVLSTPLFLIALGILLMVLKQFALGSIIFGFVLIGFGYALLPPRNRNAQKTYRRDDFPMLFELLDQISKKLGTTAPDGVHLTDDFNAYMAQFRRPLSRQSEWVVGIGMPLWVSSSNAERIAHLAHEIAHKVNNDPLRTGIFFSAKSVLANWHDTFYVDEDGYDNIGIHHGYSAPIFRVLAAGFVGFLYRILISLSFFESQRAEYRADAFASRVSGNRANITSLEMFTREELARRAIVDLYPYTKNQSGRIFDHMGEAITGAEEAVKDRFLAEAENEKRRVDSSHPPTSMRIEFLKSLPEDTDKHAIDAPTIDFDKIDAELLPIKNALGKQLMQELYDVEVNR